VQRWRALAREAGLRLLAFANDGEFDLFHLKSPALQATGGIYLSAGIHGDEAASTEALIEWAEDHAAELRDLPLIIFPCLNPWGLINNMRHDRHGHDLNRSFNRDDLPVIHHWRELVSPFKFAISLLLHEDYDGQGLYLYEIKREEPYWGEGLLEAARPVIPIEGRTRIEGRKSTAGVVRRRMEMKRFTELGYPEAIWLHLHGSRRTFTVETPSEFALGQRVAAHKLVIEECVRRLR
jgi:hypothetical protein